MSNSNIVLFPLEVTQRRFDQYIERQAYEWLHMSDIMTEKEFNWYRDQVRRADVEEDFWFIDNDRDITTVPYEQQDPADVKTLKHHMLIMLGIIEDDSILD